MAQIIQFARKTTIVSSYEAAIVALNAVKFYAGMPAWVGYKDGAETYYLLAIGVPSIGAEGEVGATAYHIVSKTQDATIIDRIKVDGDGTKFLNDAGEYVKLDTGVISVNGKTGVVTVIEGALEEGVTVKGVSFGSISDGTVLPKGMTLTEFVKKMFIKQIPPTYTQPTIAFTSPVNQTKEAGEVLNLSVAAKFTQNDAGALTELRLTRSVGGAAPETIASGTANPATYAETTTKIGDNSVVYGASATYAEGAVKNDNLGSPYPTGHIVAGTKNASNVTITGKRKMFFGSFKDATTVLDSTAIRGLKSVLNPQASTVVQYAQFPVAAGDIKFVIAIPKSYGRGIKEVLQNAEGFNLNVTANFVKQSTSIQVEGANGFTAVDYDVYVWTSAAAFSAADSFKVSLK